MKKLSLLLVSFCFFHLASANAQVRPVEEIYPGYNASVLENAKQVETLFNGMPTSFKMKRFLSAGSQCFQRAQIWTYDFYRNKRINSMKVFVFYTHAYKAAYRRLKGEQFDWWFHVAPYLLAKDENGQVQEWAVDPSFAEKPLNIHDWSMLFVDTHKKCKEYVPYSQFRSEVEGGPNMKMGAEHCYIVRVPATDYDNLDVEARDKGELTTYRWDMQDVEISAKLAPTNDSRSDIKRLLGL